MKRKGEEDIGKRVQPIWGVGSRVFFRLDICTSFTGVFAHP